MPTVEYVGCIYIYIYLLTGLSEFTVRSTIVYGVHLFTMPRIQPVVYTKSSKVLAAISCCLYCLLLTLDKATLD